MLNRIQHRRSFDPADFPTTLLAGELFVNPVQRGLAVGDGDGTPREIIGVYVFDARSQYSIGNLVTYNSTIYRCAVSIDVPHAFNGAEWTEITFSAAGLTTYFDYRYNLAFASYDHLHDGRYSLLSHLHDDRYSLLAHTHNYAATGHDHDTRYGQLAASNSWNAPNYFNANLDVYGAYLAVSTKISIGCGTGAFVPEADLHVRNTAGGIPVALIHSTVSQQARLQLANANRSFIYYINGDGSFTSVFDLSSNVPCQTWYAGGAGSVIAGYVSAPHLRGHSGGDAGGLKCHGTNNIVNYRWDGTHLYFRMDEAIERRIITDASLPATPNFNGINFFSTTFNAGTSEATLAVNKPGLNTGYVGTGAVISDPTLKRDIAVSTMSALAGIRAIDVIEFRWNAEARAAAGLPPVQEPYVPLGLNAAQLKDIIPEMVFEHEGLKRLALDRGVPWLIKAVQQLAEEVERLKRHA